MAWSSRLTEISPCIQKWKKSDHYPTQAPRFAINLFDSASNISKRYFLFCFALFGVALFFTIFCLLAPTGYFNEDGIKIIGREDERPPYAWKSEGIEIPAVFVAVSWPNLWTRRRIFRKRIPLPVNSSILKPKEMQITKRRKGGKGKWALEPWYVVATC